MNHSDIDWDFIIETIKDEKCILFIGPEIFRDRAGRSLDEQLGEFLDATHTPDIQTYYQQDGLFLFTSGAKKTTSYYKIKSFYHQSFPSAEALFSKLAKIPFHFIISITPDSKCVEVLEREGVPVKFDFYWKKQPAGDTVKTPVAKAPLVYNMFGSVSRQESMVLTHDDLFEYFESIFQENNMPEKLKLNIKNADNFIFLGLDFEKWYMQLLLRILYLHNEKYEFMRYAANQQISDQLKTFCFQQFKIEFVSKKIDDFVEDLAQRCAAAGLVREHKEQNISVTEQLLKWLSEDRTDEVFEEFTTFLESHGDSGKELLDDLILLANRHKRLQRKQNLQVVDSREAELESNKIRLSLLELINEAKSLE